MIKDHNFDQKKNGFKIKSKNLANKKDIIPLPYYNIIDLEDKTLIFESRFESGNLLAAYKVTDIEYDLILQNDINTNGHT